MENTALENTTVSTVPATELMQAVPQGFFQRNPKLQSSQAARDATHPHLCKQTGQFICNHLVWFKQRISSCLAAFLQHGDD